MINFILSRRNIVINEILELCLENNKILQKFKDQIFKNLIKIQEIEKICKFLIYINRKNYFGIYAPLLSKDIKKKIKLDQINLTEYFKNIIPEEIYRNKYISNQDRKTYNFFLDLELESYMFFYEKKLNDFEYNINEKNLLKCKKENAYFKIKKNEKKSGKLTGSGFVFTGFRDLKLKDEIEALGGKVSETVSAKTTVLIYKNEEDLQKSKGQKAKKLGIKIIEKDKFKLV